MSPASTEAACEMDSIAEARVWLLASLTTTLFFLPREGLFPGFNPSGSLIQGAALCSSFVIKSGLAAGGSVAEIESHYHWLVSTQPTTS